MTIIEHEPMSAGPVCRDLREIPHGDFRFRLRTAHGGFVRRDPADALAATAAHDDGGGSPGAGHATSMPVRWVTSRGGILSLSLPTRPGRYRVEVRGREGCLVMARDIWMIDDDEQIGPMWAAVKATRLP